MRFSYELWQFRKWLQPRLELAYHRVLNILGEVGLSEKCNLLRPYTAQDIPAAVSSQPPYPITCHKQKAPFDYVESLLPKLLHHKVILLRPSASQREDRFPVLAKSTQCQACFHALRLVKALQNEAESLLQQIPRPFVALHLRFEPDMIAYSRCLYNNLSTASVVAIDQAQGTRQVLGKKLQKSWRTRGKCPLTPKETASLLLALKVPSSTTIYIAAGTGLLEFHELASAFPRAVQKSNFLTKRSLKALGGSRAAAIDWYVCLHSDAYIATFTGNMDKMVISDRILASKQQNMILNRRYFAELKSEGKSTFEISGLIWQAHKQDVISGRNLPVTDCFCGEGRAPKPWKNHVIATLAPCLLWNLHVYPMHSWLQLQLPTLLLVGLLVNERMAPKAKRKSTSFVIGNSNIWILQWPPTIENPILRTE